MSDVRRVDLENVGGYARQWFGEWTQTEDGTHALLPWEEYERLRKNEKPLNPNYDQVNEWWCEEQNLRHNLQFLVAKQEKENERLWEERDQAVRDADEYMAKEAQLNREVLDLRAENERLRNRIEDFKKTRSFGKILELEDEIERLQRAVEKADRIIKNETPSGIYHNWQTALRELEDSDG